MAVNPCGTETLAVSNVSIGLASIPSQAKGCDIEVHSNAVYFNEGTAVAAAGSSDYLNPYDHVIYDSWTPPGNNWRSAMAKARFIRASSDAVLFIRYYD